MEITWLLRSSVGCWDFPHPSPLDFLLLGNWSCSKSVPWKWEHHPQGCFSCLASRKSSKYSTFGKVLQEVLDSSGTWGNDTCGYHQSLLTLSRTVFAIKPCHGGLIKSSASVSDVFVLFFSLPFLFLIIIYWWPRFLKAALVFVLCRIAVWLCGGGGGTGMSQRCWAACHGAGAWRPDHWLMSRSS